MASMAREKINKKLKLLLLFSIFLGFSYFITRGINLPYVGYNAWNFNTYSLIAKNYNTFGYLETKLAPIVSGAERLPSKPKYYLHHPQLLPVIESLLFRVFGEHFWVGRLTVILFSLGSMILTYRIAYFLRGNSFGILALGVSTLIPATSVFGRMIDMEPLVLFFSLGVIYSLLHYVKSKKPIYLFFTFFSIAFGTLSDWPMTYFTLSLLPLLVYKKRFKLGLAMIMCAFLVELTFLSYVFLLMSGFSDMVTAILTRSTGELLTRAYWPFFWIATILVRFLLYFNPVFVLFSCFFLWTVIRQLVKKQFTEKNLVMLSLFSLGFFYVALFPEGSYGHAYWIYYFVPFVALSSAEYLAILLSGKRYLILIIIFSFSFVFLWRINDWKVKEVKANVFRYTLAEKANAYLSPYEPILVNPDGVIDPDLLMYKFRHEVQVMSENSLPGSHKGKVLVYSCNTVCNPSDRRLKALLQSYKNTSVQTAEAQAYIIVLDQKQEKPSLVKAQEKKNTKVKEKSPTKKENILKTLYRQIKDFLQAPQI